MNGLPPWRPSPDSGPLRLSENVTHVYVSFTAYYCDETAGPGSLLSEYRSMERLRHGYYLQPAEPSGSACRA
jgi:hypothetical protein